MLQSQHKTVPDEITKKSSGVEVVEPCKRLKLMQGETGQLTLKESFLKKSYPTTLKRNSNKITQCKYYYLFITY